MFNKNKKNKDNEFKYWDEFTDYDWDDRTKTQNTKQKSKKFRLSTLIFILALLPIVYLLVGRLNLSKQVNKTLKNYVSQTIFETKVDENLTKQHDEYNKQLANGDFNTEPPPDFNRTNRYEEIKLDSSALEVLGIIYIPKIDIMYPIYHGTSYKALENGVGIMEKTSLPGGINTNSVLTAHRGTQNGDFFRHLDKLEDDDAVYIYYNGELLKYYINGKDIVQPNDGSKIVIEPGQDKITLLTCTPYLINTERLLYYGYRTSVGDNELNYILKKIEDVEKPGYQKIVNNIVKPKNEIPEEVQQTNELKVKDKISINSGLIFTIILAIMVILSIIAVVNKFKRRRYDEE